MKYFMLDIETMGTADTDDIIQIGLLEVHKSGPYYSPGRSFEQILHSDQETTNPWILKTHAELLPKVRAADYEAPAIIRAKILAFMRSCVGDAQVGLMGLNATSFDIPFCLRAGLLKKEDFHYRVYELRGAYQLAMDVLNLQGQEFFDLVNNSCEWVNPPSGSKHTALYDCYNQLKTLNGITKVLLK